MEQDGPRQEAADTNAQRTWARRVTRPIKYLRVDVEGVDGVSRIFFDFDFPPGNHRISDAVRATMDEFRTHPDGQKSGLRSSFGGTVWRLLDNEPNRLLAARIDLVLQGLDSKFERQQLPPVIPR